MATSPGATPFCPPPRRRYLGELVEGGWRTHYTTDSRSHVDPTLEHLEGLLGLFWKKFDVDQYDTSQTLMVGARFTYLADAFDRVSYPGDRAPPSRPGAAGAATPSTAEGGSGGSGGPGILEDEEDVDVEVEEPDEGDPVDSVQLHCLWPSFPRDSFVDNAVYSELDPRLAPFWTVRLLRADGAPLPLTQRLQNLLEFRKEAQTVRSAEQCVQPQMPKTAFASLSYAIQESLESILLPSWGEMMELTQECLALPTVLPTKAESELQRSLAPLRGAARGTRLARFAEMGASMKCFKGAVMLWCQMLGQMRKQWDALEPPPPGATSPETRRVGARGVRAELFDASVCLVQQKLEMLQRSVEARVASDKALTPGKPTLLKLGASGAALVAPSLLQPALLTEDMVVQADMAAASISDPAERAALHSREVCSDVAAFKAANPEAELADFVAWRSHVEGLKMDPFPQSWLEQTWGSVSARPAAEQSAVLFQAEREAEMALHYLENVEGTQLLLQIFRVVLRLTLEELAESVTRSSPAHLRVLRDRAVMASLGVFRGDSGGADAAEVDAVAAIVGEVVDFPAEDKLQTAIAAVEALESAVRLAASLRAKLPGPGEGLLEELLAEGEASVTTQEQRHAVEELFARGRMLAVGQMRENPDGRGVFESLPLAKEFVLQLQPAASGSPTAGRGGRVPKERSHRMYAEVRERHQRLATVRCFRVA